MSRTNEKAVSNEAIIAALLQNGTIKEAAAAAGTTPRTIYDRMRDRDFRAAYSDAKTDLMRRAVISINEKLAAAIETVSDIMSDENANPAIRLQAAQAIINNAGKFADRLIRQEDYSRELRSPLSAWDDL